MTTLAKTNAPWRVAERQGEAPASRKPNLPRCRAEPLDEVVNMRQYLVYQHLEKQVFDDSFHVMHSGVLIPPACRHDRIG
jgi:hypothetical protein